MYLRTFLLSLPFATRASLYMGDPGHSRHLRADGSAMTTTEEEVLCDEPESPTHMVAPGVNVSSDLLVVRTPGSDTTSQLRCPHASSGPFKNRMLGYAKQINVYMYDMFVHYVGNDAGSYEEWRMKFQLDLFYSNDYESTHVSVKDEARNKWYDLGISLEASFMHTTSGPDRRYVVKIWGDEDDQWPNGDDTLPTCKNEHFEGDKGWYHCTKSYDGRKYTVYYYIWERSLVRNRLLKNKGDRHHHHEDNPPDHVLELLEKGNDDEACTNAATIEVSNNDRYDVVSVRVDGDEQMLDGQTISPGQTFSFLTKEQPSNVVVGVGKWESGSPLVYWSQEYQTPGCSSHYGLTKPSTQISDLLTLFQSTEGEFCGGTACFHFNLEGTYELFDGGDSVEVGNVELISWPDNSSTIKFTMTSNEANGDDKKAVSFSHPWNCFTLHEQPDVEYCRN